MLNTNNMSELKKLIQQMDELKARRNSLCAQISHLNTHLQNNYHDRQEVRETEELIEEYESKLAVAEQEIRGLYVKIETLRAAVVANNPKDNGR